MEAAQDASVVITNLEDTDVPSPPKVDGGKARGIKLTDSQVQNYIPEFLLSLHVLGIVHPMSEAGLLSTLLFQGCPDKTMCIWRAFSVLVYCMLLHWSRSK